MTTEQELLDLEARRVAATNSADGAALADILHEDYVHIGGVGNRLDRSAYIAWVAQLPREHRRSNLQVVAQKDVAVIVGDLQNHIHHPDGTTQIIDAVVMETAVRQNDKWRILSFQITPKRDYI